MIVAVVESEPPDIAGVEREHVDIATARSVDQVCQSPDDPDSWLITSEWETLDHFLEWESKEEHRDLVKPMRECFAEARSLKFDVQKETSH